VVLLSLLLLLVKLRDQATALLTPANNGSAKVLLRLPAKVRYPVTALFGNGPGCSNSTCVQGMQLYIVH
jgi:hypothetical protein